MKIRIVVALLAAGAAVAVAPAQAYATSQCRTTCLLCSDPHHCDDCFSYGVLGREGEIC